MKGRFFRRPLPVFQAALPLERPAQPNEQLRAAFRDHQLHRAGLDFSKVLLHDRGSKLLSDIAGAQGRGHHNAARIYARQLLTLKGELK